VTEVAPDNLSAPSSVTRRLLATATVAIGREGPRRGGTHAVANAPIPVIEVSTGGYAAAGVRLGAVRGRMRSRCHVIRPNAMVPWTAAQSVDKPVPCCSPGHLLMQLAHRLRTCPQRSRRRRTSCSLLLLLRETDKRRRRGGGLVVRREAALHKSTARFVVIAFYSQAQQRRLDGVGAAIAVRASSVAACCARQKLRGDDSSPTNVCRFAEIEQRA